MTKFRLLLFNFILLSALSGIGQNISGFNQSVSILEEKADSLSQQEDYFGAIELYNNALHQYKIAGDFENAGNILEKTANLYSYLDDYTSALNDYYEALKIAETSNNSDLLQSVYFNIGILHLKLNNIDQSLEYLFKSLDIVNTKSDSDESRLDIYMSLGTAYANKGENNSAIDYYNKASLLAKKTDNQQLYAGILNNIGAIHMSEGELERASEYFEEAFGIFKTLQNKSGMGLSLVNLASVDAEKGNFKEAINGFEAAAQYFDSISSIRLLSQTYKYLANSYAEFGNPGKSLFYLNEHIHLKDSILNHETLENLNSIRNSYIEEKARQAEKILEKQNQILKQDSRLKTNRLILIIIGLVLVLMIAGFYIFRQQTKIRINALNRVILSQEKEKLSDELKYKSKELESLAVHIVRKNDFVKTLQEETQNLSDVNASQKLANLSKMIDKQIYLDKDRKDFDLYVNQLHQSFIHKLNNHYPELTEKDKKLCSLLLLGLDSNEIASIQNISSESVKKARYRLRKKLNLDGDVNLTDFFKSL